jgi:hypothetical protein
MIETSLRVKCDNAAAAHVVLSSGSGWARVVICASRRECADFVSAQVPKAVRALAALGGVPPPLDSAAVEGPDAPADAEAIRAVALRAWNVAAHAAARDPDQAWETTPGASWGGAEPRGRSAPPAPQWAVPGGIWAPTAPGDWQQLGGAPPAEDEHQVAQLVDTIHKHVRQFGAAPDFETAKPNARARAYNYIRSAAASPHLSDGAAEAVRQRLVALARGSR